MRKQKFKYCWSILYLIALTAFTIYVLLDTFVLTKVYVVVEAASNTAVSTSSNEKSDVDESSDVDLNDLMTSDADNTETVGKSESAETETSVANKTETMTKDDVGESRSGRGHSRRSSSWSSENDENEETEPLDLKKTSELTSTSYSDENITISINDYRENDTTIYVADITLSSAEYLRTAFAQNSYGKNVTAKTSEIAGQVGAILAINGDFYGSRESGYVIRNGELYRDKEKSGQEDLVIYTDGSFGIILEDDITAKELLDNGAVQVLSFGPSLIVDGQISVSSGGQARRSMNGNPRTAIGIIDELHYVFVVADGRTQESEGLTLLELASFMKELGVKTAYNLDGGGSSTLVFNGQVINNPTTTGNSYSERSVSDIVYIGR